MDKLCLTWVTNFKAFIPYFKVHFHAAPPLPTYDRRNGSVLQITLHGVSPSKNDGYQRHATVDNNCMVQKEKVYLKYTDDKILLDQVAAHFKYDHLYILRIFRHSRVNQRSHWTPTTNCLHSQTSSSFVLGRRKWTPIIYNSRP